MQTRDSILLHPFAFIALAVVTVSTPLRAQIVGDRVRLFTADTTIIGQVTGLSDEGFEFVNDELRRSFAYRDLDRLEVSNGIRSRWAQGAAIGLTGGVLVGLSQGELPESDLGMALCVVGGWLVAPGYCFGDFVRKAFIGLAIGGGAGAGVGARMKYESWESVPLRDDVAPLPGNAVPRPGNEVVVDLPDAPRFGGGDRVRVSVAGIRLIGRVTVVNHDGLELVQGDMRRSFAYRDIDGLERSIGMRSRWKAGLGIGVFGGLVAFPTYKGAWGCLMDDWKGPSCREKEDGALAAAWVGTGALLGLGVGALIKRESWEPIALFDDMVSISPIVAPQRGLEGRHGLLLGARIEF